MPQLPHSATSCVKYYENINFAGKVSDTQLLMHPFTYRRQPMRLQFPKGPAVLLALVGITCLPSTLVAADISDVALSSGGVLRGRLVGPRSRPLAYTRVTIRQPHRPAVATVTTKDGHFEATGLSGGVCQVETDRGGRFYRLWSSGTAPPAAAPNADVRTGGRQKPGQEPVDQSIVATLFDLDQGPPREGNPGGNGIGNGPGGRGRGHARHGNGRGVGHTNHGRGHGYGHTRPASP